MNVEPTNVTIDKNRIVPGDVILYGSAVLKGIEIAGRVISRGQVTISDCRIQGNRYGE